jgi:hypothetical protein
MEDKRGGVREGAGRPAEVKDPRPVTVTLDEAAIEAARDLGGGNISAGIREALRRTNGTIMYVASVLSNKQAEGSVAVMLVGGEPICHSYAGSIGEPKNKALFDAAFELAARKAGVCRKASGEAWKTCKPADRNAFIQIEEDGSFAVIDEMIHDRAEAAP